ncbi:MAG: alkyl hydroperoxide reductase [Acidobacteriota bacterium]
MIRRPSKTMSLLALARATTVATATTVVTATAAFASSETAANNNADAPTYAGEVAQLLNDNCVQCHRPGQTAPMSLQTYKEVRPWARSVSRHVEARTMPPWHAVDGAGAFTNDRSLSQSDIDTIVDWVQAGAPAGDLAAAPEPPTFPEGEWQLGEPDKIVTFDEIEVKAGDRDEFHDLVGKLLLPEDKWLTGIEILPGNSKVVHHVIIYEMKGFDFDPTEGWLGAWAAGAEPMVFPEGTGRRLQKGSNLIADMHYHPADTDEVDQTRIGLYFSDEPPEKELTNIWIMNANFKIPAGADNHEVRASHRFWQSGKLLTLTPHMHYRGRDMEYIARFPDGSEKTLLKVDNYDFNWQTVYELEEPVDIPAGTVVEAIAHYDNSSGNPVNPDPTIDVTFGNESYDEMMIAFADFIVDEGVRPMTPSELRTSLISEVAAKHPGAVYSVSGKPIEKRDEPNSWAPLYLPEEGDGIFYVIWNGDLHDSKITDVTWEGKKFSGKLQSPYGAFDLTGERTKDGKITTTIDLPNNDVTFDGALVEGP